MSGTLNEQLQQIADTKDAIAQAISGKGVEVTPEDSFASYALKINEIQGSGSGETIIVQGGNNLFDIKIADHTLEGNEALGWAEQGTNVYKTDYPDFYAKCFLFFDFISKVSARKPKANSAKLSAMLGSAFSI